jgi:hypothetical protein
MKSITSSETDGHCTPQSPKEITSTSSLSDEEVERIQKLLRRVMRMKLKIPCHKVYYVEGWGWL